MSSEARERITPVLKSLPPTGFQQALKLALEFSLSREGYKNISQCFQLVISAVQSGIEGERWKSR